LQDTATTVATRELASIAAWNDEEHVLANRDLYREKFDAVLEILAPVLDVQRPDGGFYLWAKVPGDEPEFARMVQKESGIGAQILSDLQLKSVRLLTNHPRKVVALEAYGIKITEQVPLSKTPVVK